jgi:hypothetical protein
MRAGRSGISRIATLAIILLILAAGSLGVVGVGILYPPLGSAIGLPQYAAGYPVLWQRTFNGTESTTGVVSGGSFFALSWLSRAVVDKPNWASYQVSAVGLTSGSLRWQSPVISLSEFFGAFPQPDDLSSLNFSQFLATPKLYALGNDVFMVSFISGNYSLGSRSFANSENSELTLGFDSGNGSLMESEVHPISKSFIADAFSAVNNGRLFYGDVSYVYQTGEGVLNVTSQPINDQLKNGTVGAQGRWQTNVSVPYRGGWGDGYGQVAVSQRYVVVVLGASATNDGGLIVALRSGDGNLVWNGTIPGYLPGTTVSVTVVGLVNDTLYYIVPSSSRLIGISLDTGGVQLNMSAEYGNADLVSGSRLLVNGDVAYSLNGEKLWTANLPSALGGPGPMQAEWIDGPWIFSDTLGLMVVNGLPESTVALAILNVTNGKFLWTHSLQESSSFRAIALGGTHFLFEWNGKMVCTDLTKLGLSG